MGEAELHRSLWYRICEVLEYDPEMVINISMNHQFAMVALLKEDPSHPGHSTLVYNKHYIVPPEEGPVMLKPVH